MVAARSEVRALAAAVGFRLLDQTRLATVTSELARNILKYARRGRLIAQMTQGPQGRSGIRLIFEDKGPGIPDIERAVRDGVTTGGSLGAGLGAIRRLMHEFDYYSMVAAAPRPRGISSPLRRTTHGTALLCRKWVEAARLEQHHAATARRYGAWSRPRPGETSNGDAYFVRRRSGATLLAVIDGLGHGHGAEEAARAALEVLGAWQGEGLEEVFQKTHDRLRPTRGAVMGACVVDARREAFYYAGVGNVEVRVFNSPEPIRPVSANGTLGARLGRLRVWQYPWAEGATVVLASDGLSASWDLGDYPGLLQKSPQLMAGVLMRDYSRDSDDATVLVARP